MTQELKLVSEPGKEVHALLLAAFGVGRSPQLSPNNRCISFTRADDFLSQLLEPQTGSTQTSESSVSDP